MKLKSILATATIALSSSMFAQNVQFEDMNFKNALLSKSEINTNGDSEISIQEALAVNGKLDVFNKGIKNLKGIEAFENIKELYIGSQSISQIDLSKNTKLVRLSAYTNQITEIDLSKNTELEFIDLDGNKLTNIDLSQNKKLKELRISRNRSLKSLDLSHNKLITDLNAALCGLESIDLSNNLRLKYVELGYNNLTFVDFSKHSEIVKIDLAKNKLSGVLDLRSLPQLRTLYIYRNTGLTCIQLNENVTITGAFQKDDTAQWNCSDSNLSVENTSANLVDSMIINPVKDNLIIKTSLKINKIEIYSIAGQLVKILTNNTQVSDLARGIYLAKITTDKGVTTHKIIKE